MIESRDLEQVLTVYSCTECKGEDIKYDAWAVWNVETQTMELDICFAHERCSTCEKETDLGEAQVKRKDLAAWRAANQ